MQITVSNANVSNSTNVNENSLYSNGFKYSDSLKIGAVTINSSTLAVGNSIVNSSVFSVNYLTLGGTMWNGIGPYSAIVNTQIFTANGTWTNPLLDTNNPISNTTNINGNSQVFMMLWGGGGAGNATLTYGGGGGACVVHQLPLSAFTSTCAVTVGPGGTASDVGGGNSVFVVNSSVTITAYGGTKPATSGFVGGGGGWFGMSNSSVGGGPLGSNLSVTGAISDSTFGGSGANNTAGGNNVFGGGWGGVLAGLSIYGGSGGTKSDQSRIIGPFGGPGANASFAASVPGGGGSTVTNIDGARGEVRVWVIS